MYRSTGTLIGLTLVLTLTLTRGGMAQQPQHQHPGVPPASQEQPAATDTEEAEGQEHAPMMQQMHGMMGPGGMMIQRHIERLAQQLRLSDEQPTQAQTLVRHHAKDVIRLQADIDTMALDVRPLLDADPVDLAKVKQLLQAIAAKEADVRLAHITAMQDVRKLLTPEQQKQFRTMQGHMIGDGGMMGREGMMGHGSKVQ
jgi:Spy/CpxP family protein refolding chaperone